jgi:hypothetical protein
MKASLSLSDYEEFSAYLDGQLSPSEKARVEETLIANPERKAALEELAATRTLLRSAPRYRAPRNFTISAETARTYARKPLFPNLFAFRFSAALSALSLVVVLAIQVFSQVPLATQNTVALAPAAAEAPAAAPMAKAQTDSAGANPESAQAEGTMTIEWDNTSQLAMGKGGGPSTNAGAPSVSLAQPNPGGYGGGAPDNATPAPINGVVALPPNAVEDSTQDSSARIAVEGTPAPQDQASSIQGSGPILGVPQEGESGKLISPNGEIQTDQYTDSSTRSSGLNTRQMVQIALAGLAVIAAGLAIFFRIRSSR